MPSVIRRNPALDRLPASRVARGGKGYLPVNQGVSMQAKYLLLIRQFYRLSIKKKLQFIINYLIITIKNK